MITYNNVKDIDIKSLETLFKAVDWESRSYPVKLKKAIQNSYLVYTAWEDESLVGLINCISEGSLYAYVPFLLVHPAKRNNGIGKQLLKLLSDNTKHIKKIILNSEPNTIEFYRANGFSEYEDAFPMYMDSKCPKT